MAFNPLSLLFLTFRGRSVAVFRDHCSLYDDMLAVARRTFRSLQDVPEEDIVLSATIPGYPVADRVELSKNIWSVVSAVVHAVTIVLESETRSITTCPASPVLPDYEEPLAFPAPPTLSSSPTPRPCSSSPLRRFFSRLARTPLGDDPQQQSRNVVQTIRVTFSPLLVPTPEPLELSEAGLLGKWISYLHEIIGTVTGYSSSNSILTFNGTHLSGGLRLADYDAASGDAIMVAPYLRPPPDARPRKPVIYLYSPSRLPEVTVELLLTPSWRFSAVYPPPQTTIPPGSHHTAQSLTWVVAAEPDGTLVDKTTGTEVSYLFWEATINSRLVTPDASRTSTPVEDIEIFDPSHPSVNPGDSVLLPTGNVPGYLDIALKALSLNTEARTSFITYWLPDLLKHQYVALRFLAQASYEKAARMRISPAPDVVTRVFMLFRGVAQGDLGLWVPAAARATAEDGATFWAHVVGVDAARGSDRGLYRVLEWGGMEVR